MPGNLPLFITVLLITCVFNLDVYYMYRQGQRRVSNRVPFGTHFIPFVAKLKKILLRSNGEKFMISLHRDTILLGYLGDFRDASAIVIRIKYYSNMLIKTPRRVPRNNGFNFIILYKYAHNIPTSEYNC